MNAEDTEFLNGKRAATMDNRIHEVKENHLNRKLCHGSEDLAKVPEREEALLAYNIYTFTSFVLQCLYTFYSF